MDSTDEKIHNVVCMKTFRSQRASPPVSKFAVEVRDNAGIRWIVVEASCADEAKILAFAFMHDDLD